MNQKNVIIYLKCYLAYESYLKVDHEQEKENNEVIYFDVNKTDLYGDIPLLKNNRIVSEYEKLISYNYNNNIQQINKIQENFDKIIEVSSENNKENSIIIPEPINHIENTIEKNLNKVISPKRKASNLKVLVSPSSIVKDDNGEISYIINLSPKTKIKDKDKKVSKVMTPDQNDNKIDNKIDSKDSKAFFPSPLNKNVKLAKINISPMKYNQKSDNDYSNDKKDNLNKDVSSNISSVINEGNENEIKKWDIKDSKLDRRGDSKDSKEDRRGDIKESKENIRGESKDSKDYSDSRENRDNIDSKDIKDSNGSKEIRDSLDFIENVDKSLKANEIRRRSSSLYKDKLQNSNEDSKNNKSNKRDSLFKTNDAYAKRNSKQIEELAFNLSPSPRNSKNHLSPGSPGRNVFGRRGN